MGRLDSMTFDPEQEYGNTIPGEKYASGKDYIDAIINDAKKTLPPGTQFSFITWDEDGRRRAGWVYNLKTERPRQKLFNPLETELRT